jgi:uncharacterized protein with gpF-like domain
MCEKKFKEAVKLFRKAIAVQEKYMTEFEIPEEAMEELQNKKDEAIDLHNEDYPGDEIDDEDWLSGEEDDCFRSDHKDKLEHQFMVNPLQMAFTSMLIKK